MLIKNVIIHSMIERDNLHYSFQSIQGYNKPFNFVMSPREPGKTTSAWLDLVYLPWKKNKKPFIYLVRNSVEINDALIDSIFDTIINKFTDDEVKPQYNRSSFSEGICDIKIDGEIFVRIVSLSIKLRKIKLAVLKNVAGVLMDEYIIDPRTKEKYETNEAFKIKEAYTTWRRECDGMLKCYFLGNPYSLYNPLFIDWGVNVSKLRKDSFYVGDTFVIHWAILSPELRAMLLSKNPLFQFDEDYVQYALEGTAINDKNIKIAKQPENYHLRFVFRINNKNLGIFQNNYWEDGEDRYFCKFIDDVSAKRTMYCFAFEDLVERCVITSREERDKLNKFKIAMRRRAIAFEDINCYYMTEEIYNNL